jgi:hypothetical protein
MKTTNEHGMHPPYKMVSSFIIILVSHILLTVNMPIYAQVWHPIVNTGATSYARHMDVLTTNHGVNVLFNNFNFSPYNDDLRFVQLNQSGVIIRQATLDNDTDFPTIVGANNILFAVYQRGPSIKIQRSINAGISWSSSAVPSISLSSAGTTGLDAAYDKNGLHVVWEADSDIYYQRYNGSAWVDFKKVTDHAIYNTGVLPTLSISSDRIHVGFTHDHGSAITRDYKRSSSQWESPQLVYGPASGGEAIASRVFATDTDLHVFYNRPDGCCPIPTYLYHTKRPIGGTAWSSGTILGFTGTDIGNLISQTDDGIMHIIYDDGLIVYRNYNGTTWSQPLEFPEGTVYGLDLALSSKNNDIFAVWRQSGIGTTPLRYRKYTGILISELIIQNDIVFNGENLVFETVNTIVAAGLDLSSNPTSFNVLSGGNVTFNVNSVSGSIFLKPGFEARTGSDFHAYIGSDGSQGNITISEEGRSVINIEDSPIDYTLMQNFPNPFNPMTTITFSIPEYNYVSVTVYNILGQEVAVLINEAKNPGVYNVVFNAHQLPSGMYIYRIQAGRFHDVKTMVLTK